MPASRASQSFPPFMPPCLTLPGQLSTMRAYGSLPILERPGCRSRAGAEMTPTAKNFETFLPWLDLEGDAPGTGYVRMHRKLVYYFERAGCPTPGECADETLDRAAKKARTPVKNPPAFCFAIARFVLMECRRRAAGKPQKPLDGQSTVAADGGDAQAGDTDHLKRRAGCTRKCLREWVATDRLLFLRYRLAPRPRRENRQKLARRRGLTLNALRIKMHRMERQLLACTEDCMKSRPAA